MLASDTTVTMERPSSAPGRSRTCIPEREPGLSRPRLPVPPREHVRRTRRERGARQWDAAPDHRSQGRESNPQLRGMNPARYLFLHPAFTKPLDAARVRRHRVVIRVEREVRRMVWTRRSLDYRRRSVRQGVACVPSAPHAAGRPGSPVRMHRCQTALDGVSERKTPHLPRAQVGRGEDPSGLPR